MNIIFHCPSLIPLRNNSGHDLRIGGQALAEILFALAVAILLINGLVVAMRSGISNSQFSQHKVQSVHLAQQSMERARSIRDNGEWINLGSNANLTLMGDTGAGFVTLDGVNFNRDVTVTPSTIINPNDARIITVTVSWNEFNRPVQTELRMILTNWR